MIMTDFQWDAFLDFRQTYKAQCKKWLQTAKAINLQELQKTAAALDKVPPYPIENPIVYNTALDEITSKTDIRLLVIGDNPGKEEQLNKNQKYLVGLAGKIAAGYFQKNPELNIDFRKNAIILNKTPIHSAKTKELSKILSLADNNTKKIFADLLEESQVWCAKATAKLHQAFAKTGCQLWLVGYSELKDRCLFEKYRKTLEDSYLDSAPKDQEHIQLQTQAQEHSQFQRQRQAENQGQCHSQNSWAKVLVFQHFSMNRFTIDLGNNYQTHKSLLENIVALGTKHKKDIGMKE